MKRKRRLDLNLAGNPLRNKRLFRSLFFFIGTVSVLWLIIGMIVFWKNRNDSRDIEAALAGIENKIDHVRREERRYITQADKLSQENLSEVNVVNHLISQKAFSWTEMFTALEKSLPDDCYIVSISPVERGDSEAQVKLEVASSGLDPLFQFIDNLYSMDFSGVKLIRERKSETGSFISEVSLDYDKIF
jgi:Tfp pilus assembly protein PilN